MLQMKCPKCDATIHSPFLVEIGTVECNECKADVAVKDVFVATRGFTMHRDTLLGRVRHYRALLNDVEKERTLLEKRDPSQTAAKKGLDQYHDSLQELLAAARGNYRLAISQNLPLNIEWSGHKGDGNLLNLSTKGAAIKPKSQEGLPPRGKEIKVQFVLPGETKPVALAARIAWIGKRVSNEKQRNVTLGVSFINPGQETRSHIWGYIVDTYKRIHAPVDFEIQNAQHS